MRDTNAMDQAEQPMAQNLLEPESAVAWLERLDALEQRVADLVAIMPDVDDPTFPHWQDTVNALGAERDAMLEMVDQSLGRVE